MNKKFKPLLFVMRILTLICLGSLILAYTCPYVHPSTFWLLPFFGLAYPVIIICTLLLLVFWSIQKSKMALLVALVILLGGKLHFRTFSVPFDKTTLPADTVNTLKLLSYNVRLFDLYDYKDNLYKNRNAIFEYLKEQDADVVCFQEFYHQDKPTRFPTRDTLTGILGTKYYHERYSHKLKGRQNFGIAMFSKYPMIAKGDIMFDDPENKDNNYCIFADVVKGKDTFRIYNVHLQSIKFQQDDYALFDPDGLKDKQTKSALKLMLEKLKTAFPKRADQAIKVVEHMQQSPYEVIVCGDFNDTPLSYCYNTFYSHYTDAFRNSRAGIGVTYAGRVPAGRIDYIFHSRKLESADFGIQEHVYSDHRAIHCRIWKPAETVLQD